MPLLCLPALHSCIVLIQRATVAVLLLSSVTAANADKLDDNLQTAWESLWDQRGSASPISRWEQTITFSVTGPEAASHRPLIVNAVQAAAGASGAVAVEVTVPADTTSTALLKFEIHKDGDLPETQPCDTRYRRNSNFALLGVIVRLTPKHAWRCTFHEVMHAWGIPGHPSGRTVLSYFPYRNDQLLPMDELMLKTWYLPAFKSGTTPIEALAFLSAVVAGQTDLGVPVDAAFQRSKAFNLQKIDELKALASGIGEVPPIVRRSGRASESAILESQSWAGFYLGLAYLRGTIVNRDVQSGIQWLTVSANKGHSPSQLVLARVMIRGLGVEKDRVAGRHWLSLAAKSGNTVAQAELQALDGIAANNPFPTADEKPPTATAAP